MNINMSKLTVKNPFMPTERCEEGRFVRLGLERQNIFHLPDKCVFFSDGVKILLKSHRLLRLLFCQKNMTLPSILHWHTHSLASKKHYWFSSKNSLVAASL